MKKLDLPRSYVPRGETTPALFYSGAAHHGAFLDLVGCAGRNLEAELPGVECRRGVPPNSRGEEIGPA